MAIRVASSETTREPGQESVRMSRRRGGGELDELQELFEQLVGGESLEGEEGLEDFDWEGLWDSFMEGTGEEEQQGSYYPTMFGTPVRPSGFRRPGGSNAPGQGIFY